MGKGVFTVTPSDQPLHASFKWNDKDYSFKLPAAAKSGVALSYDVEKRLATVKGVGVEPAAYAVLCRGKLVCFNRMNGNSQISLADEALPTGINELIIYDNNAQPVATRLFFVNNHDYGRTMDVKLTDADGQPVTRKTTLAPYSPINLTVSASEGDALPQTFSIAIRDTQTEDPGYDNGNIMTDMLLSSELKGFIAYPAYYFASDDEQHRKDLDILIMVQGWRKYKRAPSLRYLPETNLTYEGTVLKIPETATIQELEDLANVDTGSSTLFDEMNSQSVVTLEEETSSEEDNLGIDPNAADNEPEVTFADADDIRQGSGRLRKSVYVEAELSKEGDVAGAITATDSNGRFRINLPSFYDKAVLFVKAYTKGDSITKCMSSTKGDKDRLDERAFPDFFVKRDNFFPVFTKPYSWYQINSPDLMFVEEEDDEMIPENSRLAGNHTLNTVVVKARRRGKRAIDMTKPAIVRDLYDVFNELTDRGLSYGVANFNQLPDRICTYFFGNMGRSKQFNIRAMLEGTSFYRNYTPTNNEYDKLKTSTDMFNKLRLSRIKNVRLYTDYELRTDSGDVQESHSPDVTLVFELFEDGAKQYTYRDRRYIFDGITYAEECYSPDYSSAIPAEPTDYRRTLYWNPNAHPSADGTFTTKVYNNSRETRVTVSSAGIDSQGQMYYR